MRRALQQMIELSSAHIPHYYLFVMQIRTDLFVCSVWIGHCYFSNAEKSRSKSLRVTNCNCTPLPVSGVFDVVCCPCRSVCDGTIRFDFVADDEYREN